MAEQIKFGDRLFLAGEKVILDNKDNSPVLEARNGELIIGYNKLDVQGKDHHVLIRGDLTVEGTMTSLQTVDTVIKDNIIVLNEGEPGDGVSAIRSGIEVDRGTLDNETFLFSEEGWLGTGGVDPAIDVVLPSWLSSTLSLTNDLSAENIYARNSATINGELSVTGDAGIDGDTNIGGNANVTGNVEVTGHITASSDQEHQIGDFTFNQNVMSVVATDMEIRSPGGISFYPDSDNSLPVPQGGEKIVWLRDGTKLVFEGTVPDDYEVKLQATDITADRDIVLPDESGTLALQEWVKRELNYVQFQSIIGDGSTSDYTMNFTVAEDWQALIYIDGVLQEPTTAYTISNGDNLSFAGPIPNTSVVNIIRLANNSHTSDIVSAEDSNKLNNQPGSYYLDYNNFYNIPTNVAAFSNDAFYISVNDGYATEQYVDTKVSELVNSAPNTLDTLNELATALDNDPHFSTSITNLIGTKASTTYVNSEISTAKSEAISTASTDATTKADNARSNAISTAAADATSKANTAESNANAYTDNAIANIPAPTGGSGLLPWKSQASGTLSYGSALAIPAGATIANFTFTSGLPPTGETAIICIDFLGQPFFNRVARNNSSGADLPVTFSGTVNLATGSFEVTSGGDNVNIGTHNGYPSYSTVDFTVYQDNAVTATELFGVSTSGTASYGGTYTVKWDVA